MGFMKKFFSLGHKKGKKVNKRMEELSARDYSSMPNRAAASAVALNVIEPEPELPKKRTTEEADANYLLRSSSTHYKVVSEFDYAALPPLPHPINRLITGSTLSLTSTATSVAKPAYTVQVHPKTVIAEAEYTEKSYSSDTQDTSLLLRLRGDPSVVSLLNMYDDYGKLPDQAFANSSFGSSTSPPTSEEPILSTDRVQVRRSGSTLRQLLGEPEESDGEISWAERHLRESETSSIDSSVGLKTPTDTNTRFVDDNVSCATPDVSSPHESFDCTIAEIDVNVTQECIDPKTPQRASQVFAFITSKARNPREDFDSSFRHSSPPSFVDNTPQSKFSSDSSSASPSTSLNSHPSPSSSQSYDSDTKCVLQSALITQQSRALSHFRTRSADVLSQTPPPTLKPTSQDDCEIPQLVVTIPTPSAASHRPRGPRTLPVAFAERSSNIESNRTPEDPFSPVPLPIKDVRTKNHSRRTSHSRKPIPVMDKENTADFASSLGLHVTPSTLVRPVSLRSKWFKPPAGMTASENTSSELSPVGRQLMMDLRAQRASARAKEAGLSRRH